MEIITGICGTCEKRNECETHKKLELTCMLGGLTITAIVCNPTYYPELIVMPTPIDNGCPNAGNKKCAKKIAIEKIGKKCNPILRFFLNQCQNTDECKNIVGETK